jgi:tetratricopeptide (TPR) repeat protein
MRIEKTVFISYRRTNVPWALLIFKDLTSQGYDVFFDFIGIASGDFKRAILENIRARAHFLVLLTPSALDGCSRPDDWLRREVEEALAMRRNIVPLMLEGCDFSSPHIANQLSGKMAALKGYNTLRVPADYFDEAMGRLRGQYLSVPLDAVLHPMSSVVRDAAHHQQQAAIVAPAVQERELTAQKYLEQAFRAADLREAIRLYGQVIRLEPDNAYAYYKRASHRDATADFAGAREDYDTAIRLKPDDSDAYNNRGVLRVVQGDIGGAREDFDTAIRLEPDFAIALRNRASLRQRQGDSAGAQEDFDRAGSSRQS